MPERVHVGRISACLPTITVDGEGCLTRNHRTTDVDIYAVLPGEKASIYELGVPVMASDDIYHADVRQKVPLSVDRNSVTPYYMKQLRAAVLDATYKLLTPEQATTKGVADALSRASPEAVRAVMDKRFGEKRFVPDFNRAATGALTAEGFTAVPTNAFDAETFAAIKAAGAIQSGGQLRPQDSTAGEPWTDITPGMEAFRAFTETLAKVVLGMEISWVWAAWDGCPAQCEKLAWNRIALTFNVRSLGVDWFKEHPASNNANLEMIFHELGHYNGAMDCTREHCDGVTKVAAGMVVLMQQQPELLAKFT
jgi:hypothetical protein